MNRKAVADARHDITFRRFTDLRNLLEQQPVMHDTPVDRLVWELVGLRREIAAEGRRMGLQAACEGSIPHCRGECCRYHYPSPLSIPDILVIMVAASSDCRERTRHCIDSSYPENQCLFLGKDGCIFPVEIRPLPCVAAYPCHTTAGYRDYLSGVEGRRKTLQQDAIRLLKTSGLLF